MPRYGRVALGGTFDRLHLGHEALLGAAFQVGRHVAIGLTTAAYLTRTRKALGGRILSEGRRRRTLARWLRARYPRRRWTVVRLDTPFGRAVEEGIDALVVSADTVPGGRAVNRERRRLGRRSVPLVVVPIALADDLGPVSSSRIRRGEIDRRGRRLQPLTIRLHADPVDRQAARAAIRSAFPRARVVERRARPRLPRASGPRRRGTTRRPRGDGLELEVSSRRRTGWVVVLQGVGVRNGPATLRGHRPSDLTRGLREWLSPSRARASAGRDRRASGPGRAR